MPPIDHLPASLRDRDCLKRAEEIERRKTLFRQARGVAMSLRSITDRQRGGRLTRADGHILSLLVLQNLRACVRRERHYRPTRAMLAKSSGYSERTVSASIGRLKAAGIIVVARYATGGRLGNKGTGLATEFRSGCLQFLAEQLDGLGYRLPKALRADLSDLAAWAAAQVGEHTQPSEDTSPRPKPTGKKVPGTIVLLDRASPSVAGMAQVAGPDRTASGRTLDPSERRRNAATVHCKDDNRLDGTVDLSRPRLGRLALEAISAVRRKHHRHFDPDAGMKYRGEQSIFADATAPFAAGNHRRAQPEHGAERLSPCIPCEAAAVEPGPTTHDRNAAATCEGVHGP